MHGPDGVAALLHSARGAHLEMVDALRAEITRLRSQLDENATGHLNMPACRSSEMKGEEFVPGAHVLSPTATPVKSAASLRTWVGSASQLRCSAGCGSAEAVGAPATPPSPAPDRSPFFPRLELPRIFKHYQKRATMWAENSAAQRIIYNQARTKLPRNGLEQVVQSAYFELFFAAVIVLNACVMSLDVQYRGMKLGHRLYDDHEQERHVWSGADDAFSFIEWVFGILFTAEVVLKLCDRRLAFFCSAWNLLDAGIVAMWITEVSSSSLGFNTQFIRLARLARLGRVLRLVRTVHSIDPLFLIITSLKGSTVVLFWACLLLLCVLMFLALVIFQLLSGFYFESEAWSAEQRQEVYVLFGSFNRALFTLFELAFGNWPTPSRVLAENVSTWFMPFAIVYKLTIGFAVVGVINSVFIQETFKVAAIDDRIMVRQKQRAVSVHRRKMELLFTEANKDHDDGVSIEEFRLILDEPEMRLWLASMDVDPGGDIDFLYQVLDKDGDGSVSVEELVQGTSALKGAARSIDLIRLSSDFKDLRMSMENNFGGYVEALE